ncbi:MAG TPA: hypothetical protein VGD98_11380 [Ktedonobacteraceae bacterium]
MNSQEIKLTPCPECGGPRAWFRVERESIYLNAGSGKLTRLYACTCLACGTATLRPAPEKMQEIRQWAQTQKPFDFNPN